MKIKNLKYSLAILGIATTVVLTGCGEKRKVQIGDSVIEYYNDEIKGTISYNELVRNIKVVTFEENNNLYHRLLVKDIKSNYTDLDFDSEAGILVRYFDLKTDSCLMSYVDYHNGKVAHYIGENLNIVEEKEISSYLLKEDFVKTDYEVEEVIKFFYEKIEPSLSTGDEVIESDIEEEVAAVEESSNTMKEETTVEESSNVMKEETTVEESSNAMKEETEKNTIVENVIDADKNTIPYEDVYALRIYCVSDKSASFHLCDQKDDEITTVSIDIKEINNLLNKLPNVEHINIGLSNSIDGSFLNNFSKSEKVSYLYMLNCTEETLESISNFKNLESLSIRNCQLSNISPLSNLTNLNYLDLSNNSISDLSPLSNLTDLKILWLDYNLISDISPLSNLTNLEILNLDYNTISDISPLSNLTNIYSLYLSVNFISDISPLSNLTKLGNLQLDNNSISDVSPLSNLTNLRTLNLEYNNISDISPLDGLEIKELDLYGNTHIVDPITFEQYNSNDDSNKEYSLK